MSFIGLSSARHFKSAQTKLHRFLSSSPPKSYPLLPNAPLDVAPEIRDALAAKKPVVALESTLITHGFPSPENYELSLNLEKIVRSTGAIPATIGIVGGRIKIGLDKTELARLADPANSKSVVKVSRRDIAATCATKADGGTTCSATTVIAAMSGIKVFATGGLGGVHRGGELSMDVSADLQELTRNPVGLVSSGVKSILDIGRTLEYLETLGVPVVAYGKTRNFPAFFSPRSGFEVPWNVDNPALAAGILYTQAQLGMDNGVFFAVPIPEKYEAAGAEIQLAVDQAVAESEQNGVSKRGKDATPWLLHRISELTKGTSLVSNTALLENTALVGGQIAVEYQKLANLDNTLPTPARITAVASSKPIELATPVLDPPQSSSTARTNEQASLVVLGAAAVDVSSRAFNVGDTSAIGSTVPGVISVSLGGVGRNVAEAAHRVALKDDSVLLVAPLGADSFGHLLMKGTEDTGMRTDGFLWPAGQRTAVCNMILSSEGSLTTGIADMAITEALAPLEVLQIIERNKPSILALDSNSSPETISVVVRSCKEQRIKVFFEPTSVVKSTRILKAISSGPDAITSPIDFISPNLIELGEIYRVANEMDLLSRPDFWAALDSFGLGSQYRMDLEQLSRRTVSDELSSKGTLSFLLDQGIAQMGVRLLPFFRHIIIKCGDKGVLVIMRISKSNVEHNWLHERTNVKARYIVSGSDAAEMVVVAHYPAIPVPDVINVTGAGDSFVGALLACIVQRPHAFGDPVVQMQIIDIAQRAAVLTLTSHDAVSSQLSGLKDMITSIIT